MLSIVELGDLYAFPRIFKVVSSLDSFFILLAYIYFYFIWFIFFLFFNCVFKFF